MRFVVDASVARAASPSPNAQAIGCFQSLKSIRENDFSVVFSPRLSEEYHRHQSRTFAGWLRKMLARKKVHHINANDEKLKISEIAKFINDAKCAPNDLSEILKDLHLFACALLTDERILSCDKEIIKRIFRALGVNSMLGDIFWSNPQEHDVAGWIDNGAKAEPKMQLKNYIEKN